MEIFLQLFAIDRYVSIVLIKPIAKALHGVRQGGLLRRFDGMLPRKNFEIFDPQIAGNALKLSIPLSP